MNNQFIMNNGDIFCFREFDSALKDVQEALILLQPQNKEVRRVLLNLRDEIRAGQRHKSASIDTLNNSSSLTTDL